VGVGGGIAAYKSAELVSRLVQNAYPVCVVMTKAAQRFVAPDTFAALTGRPVATSLFESVRYPLGTHIELADRGSILCVAPASADLLAKAAHGLADDLLSTLLLSFTGPILLAPAMNWAMWAKPAVQRNVAALREDGFQFVGPGEGWQSCRKSGVGRMAEPDEIFGAIMSLVVPQH
jgi:phosphopantothenoylcysteine decarboxylase/phosphopantothenate--cysteine ligase